VTDVVTWTIYSELHGLVTDNVCCLVKIIEMDERIIAAVQLEIKLFVFFYQSKQLTDYIYMDIYCKLSKCIGQTPCLYEHYLVVNNIRILALNTDH